MKPALQWRIYAPGVDVHRPWKAHHAPPFFRHACRRVPADQAAVPSRFGPSGAQMHHVRLSRNSGEENRPARPGEYPSRATAHPPRSTRPPFRHRGSIWPSCRLESTRPASQAAFPKHRYSPPPTSDLGQRLAHQCELRSRSNEAGSDALTRPRAQRPQAPVNSISPAPIPQALRGETHPAYSGIYSWPGGIPRGGGAPPGGKKKKKKTGPEKKSSSTDLEAQLNAGDLVG